MDIKRTLYKREYPILYCPGAGVVDSGLSHAQQDEWHFIF